MVSKTETIVPFRVLLIVLLLCAAGFAFVVVRWPDNFFADDSYFYFQVAWNFAHGHGSTFNELMPTNGYHPLWMLLCAIVYRAGAGKVAALHFIGGLISLFAFLTLFGVTRLLRWAGVIFPEVAWVLLLPFLLTTQLGTEGTLSAACLTGTLLATFRFLQRPGGSAAFACALGAALTVLSRLDNIFIVTALVTALVITLRRDKDSSAIRMLIMGASVPFTLWALYLWANHHFFGTWQPISGLLKSHSEEARRLGSNLPHIALFDLTIIALCMPLLWRMRRDRMFFVIELPLSAGVIAHALYIAFLMSSETRWSWYYTTWTLLAAILLARGISAVLGERKRLAWPMLAACGAALAIIATRNFHARGHDDSTVHDPYFQANVVNTAHLNTLLAFDKPGRIAYYSTAHIIPLDGLMGDLHFQQDLASRGIADLNRRYRVEGFIGPPQPLDAKGKATFCDNIFLSSIRFQCTTEGDGKYAITGAQIYARLSGHPAGIVPLPSSQIVWNSPGYVAVWRLEQQPR